ncbi:hypothetical protein THAOC_24187, partial [Thalassiosira oceanica]
LGICEKKKEKVREEDEGQVEGHWNDKPSQITFSRTFQSLCIFGLRVNLKRKRVVPLTIDKEDENASAEEGDTREEETS